MCPENDFSAPRRITELRERHKHLREVLTQKLRLVESVGELIQQVEASAEAVSSWDKSVSPKTRTMKLSNSPYNNNYMFMLASNVIVCCRV